MTVESEDLDNLAAGGVVWDAFCSAAGLSVEEEDALEDWILDEAGETTPPSELSAERLAELLNQYEESQ